MLPQIAATAFRGAALNGAAIVTCAAATSAGLHGPSLLTSAFRHAAAAAAAPAPAIPPAFLAGASATTVGPLRHYAAAAPPPSSQKPVELHPGLRAQAKEYAFELAYSPDYAESVRPTHRPPVKLHEKMGLWTVTLMRKTFDVATGYKHNTPQTEAQWLRRMIFLETVAGVPGMVAGVLRHLMSLRTMQKDHGWIKTMLEEAENERMHLLTFLALRQPSFLFRMMVILSQGVFFNLYFISYLISPKFCHSFVGYLEEQAVMTYTHALSDIDKGHVWRDAPAPSIGVTYWKLGPDATMRDLILAIRADEACHSYVNHRLSELKIHDENPFAPSDGATPEPKPAKGSPKL